MKVHGDESQGYCQPTGDAFRWPDVLDHWRHWEHTLPTRKLPALLAPQGPHAHEYFDRDLWGAIYNVVERVDIDNRTVEDDNAIANVIDAAVAEQARRAPTLDADYLKRTQLPVRRYSLSRYVGACDTRFYFVRDYLNGLFKRVVQ